MSTPAPAIACPVCAGPLSVRLAKGRRSGKPFLMLVCPADGRHLRAFITDKVYVAAVLEAAEGRPEAARGVGSGGG